MERTLVLIKPDGIKRRFMGEIISRFERKGLKVIALKLIHLSREKAEEHYSVHREKPFFGELVDYITSDPIVAMVLEGKSVLSVVRNLMGATDGSKAQAGTIRGDLANSIQMNLVHGSDSQESYEHEVHIFFDEKEICPYSVGDEDLV